MRDVYKLKPKCDVNLECEVASDLPDQTTQQESWLQ